MVARETQDRAKCVRRTRPVLASRQEDSICSAVLYLLEQQFSYLWHYALRTSVLDMVIAYLLLVAQ